MIGAALAYARKGLQIFPCQPRAKRPATANGLKDATTDPDRIRAWWHHEPAFNVAVATGAVSGIFVVDVDGMDAEAELRKLEAEHGTLPATIEAITARGRHVYFKMTAADVRNSASKVAPGIDIRGTGGYVLAPPYCWSVDCGSLIAAAPAWLLAKIETPKGNGNGARPPSEWRALVAEGVAEGARDCTVVKLAGYLLHRRVDPFVALEMLQIWNAARCSPPLPAADIDRIVGSIASKELKRRCNV